MSELDSADKDSEELREEEELGVWLAVAHAPTIMRSVLSVLMALYSENQPASSVTAIASLALAMPPTLVDHARSATSSPIQEAAKLVPTNFALIAEPTQQHAQDASTATL